MRPLPPGLSGPMCRPRDARLLIGHQEHQRYRREQKDQTPGGRLKRRECYPAARRLTTRAKIDVDPPPFQSEADRKARECGGLKSSACPDTQTDPDQQGSEREE